MNDMKDNSKSLLSLKTPEIYNHPCHQNIKNTNVDEFKCELMNNAISLLSLKVPINAQKTDIIDVKNYSQNQSDVKVAKDPHKDNVHDVTDVYDEGDSTLPAIPLDNLLEECDGLTEDAEYHVNENASVNDYGQYVSVYKPFYDRVYREL